MSPLSEPLRVQRLDNRPLVIVVFLAALALFLWGELRSAYPYSDPRFVSGYFSTEVQVSVFMLVATVLWFPARRIGLRWPQLANWRQLMPLAVLVLAAVGAWAATRLSLPQQTQVQAEQSWLVLRTTLMVGLNEEWIFRGLLFAAFSRWLGLRRGALVALLLFGGFHLINMVAGVRPSQSAIQFVMTIVLGSSFLLAALGSRSLLLPMLAHGLYDFAVIDIASLVSNGASVLPSAVVPLVGVVTGLFSLFQITRLTGNEPYGDST